MRPQHRGWLLLVGAGGAMAQPASSDEGMRIYKAANCVGCHKWSGIGGGSYGGAAANLRQTQLSVSQIEETVRCGRPMAGMPHFQTDAYSDGKCYGLTEATCLTASCRRDQSSPASRRHQGGRRIRGDLYQSERRTGFAQCQAFFGSDTRVCDVYARQGDGARDASAPGSAEVPPHRHMQVEAAGDANAPSASRK